MYPQLVSISNLIDFGQCVFRGTVTSKRPLATTKAGKPWFSFIIEDDGCDVKVSVFNKAEELDKLIVVGGCYKFSNALIRIKSDQSRKFDHCKSDYEVSIKDSTVVEQVENMKILNYAQAIKDIKDAINIKFADKPESIEMVKIMVKVLSVQINTGNSSEGTPWKRADLVVADASDSVRLSIWLSDDQALKENDYQQLINTCIGVTNVLVKGREYYGPQFRLTRNSQIYTEGELAEHFYSAKEFIMAKDQLSGHLQSSQLNSPSSRQLNQFSPLSSLQSTVQKSLVTVILSNDAEKQTYLGCSLCKKKCDAVGALQCACEAAHPQYYYKLFGAISDTTAQHAVTFFDPIATQIIGVSAEEFTTMDVVAREKLLLNAFEAALVLRLIPPKDDNREKLAVLAADQRIDYWAYMKGEIDELMGSDAVKIGLH